VEHPPDQIRPIVDAFSPTAAEIDQAADILLAAQAADWAPIRHRHLGRDQLHDRASYRYFWQVLQRAHRTSFSQGPSCRPRCARAFSPKAGAETKGHEKSGFKAHNLICFLPTRFPRSDTHDPCVPDRCFVAGPAGRPGRTRRPACQGQDQQECQEGRRPGRTRAGAARRRRSPNAAAALVGFGHYDCEFSQTVNVAMNPKHEGYVDVTFGKNVYTMKPVLSSTGAVRLEDVRGKTLMLQIAYKSMLMDTQAGRLVDECVSQKQLAAKKAAEGAPAGTAGGPERARPKPSSKASPSQERTLGSVFFAGTPPSCPFRLCMHRSM
jgi:hypothetical protein